MKPKIFIYVEGGLIQSIISDSPIDALILDGDTDGIERTKKYTEPDGTEFEAREAYDEVEINKKATDHYFKQK